MQNILFVGIIRKKKPTIIAVKANNLKFVNYFTIGTKEFGNMFYFRRMPVNDIIAAVGSKHATFVSFDHSQGEFEMSHTFKDTHGGYISDSVFSGDNFFSCSAQDKYIYQLRMRNFQSFMNEKQKEENQLKLEDQKRRENLFG